MKNSGVFRSETSLGKADECVFVVNFTSYIQIDMVGGEGFNRSNARREKLQTWLRLLRITK